MKSKLKILTWKYFIKNKCLELLGFLGVIFIPYCVGVIFKEILNWGFESVENDFLDSIFSVWMSGFFESCLIIFIMFSIWWLIKSNWKYARKEARKELKKEKVKR